MNNIILASYGIPLEVSKETIDLLKYVWIIPIAVGLITFILTTLVNSRKDSKEYKLNHRALITHTYKTTFNPYELSKNDGKEALLLTSNDILQMVAENSKEKNKFRCVKIKNSLTTTIVNINISVGFVNITNPNEPYSKKVATLSMGVWEGEKELIIPVLALKENEKKEDYFINVIVEYTTLAEEKFIYSRYYKINYFKTKIIKVSSILLYKYNIIHIRKKYKKSKFKIGEPITFTRYRVLKNKHEVLEDKTTS
ncbi:hypothetical protein EYB33_16910 [Lysinibacillus sphaericus]|uniref:hypothetical protein n=1 Tax=Lysinibacillus sphaericus TaxID=1421 RepID=UPI001E5354C4|nr:hypothetical protein [Lysinibacillus sphaericus]UDK97885.1 hypothetical protein EYB33_16910 [Lysinibacillus sphaericus]